MTSNSLLTLGGPCPKPFLRLLDYPVTGGFVDGRICMPIPEINATCCIPCPVTDWIYRDGFQQRSEVANWMNLAAACATLFLLVSFTVLDVKWTHRHYLSVCLAIGVFFMELAFILPLWTKPEQCHNEITPNGMHSDLTCAFSGSFLLFGGWCAVIWVFWRALSIHLQICWQVVPGPKFFYSALVLGWGVPIVGLATLLSLTGVSYRFGNVCHINHKLGLQDFWGPLLFFTAIAMILQFITIGYCIQVFVRNLFDESNTRSNNTDERPSTRISFRADTARQAYRRVKRVLELQWRGAAIVLVILGEVIFFSIIFVSVDNNTQISASLKEKATDWFICLVVNSGDPDKCLANTRRFVLPESQVLAVLICLALSGFWLLLFLGQWSMVLGWKDLITRKILKRKDVTSIKRQHSCSDPREYEMLDSSKSNPALKLPVSSQASPNPSLIEAETPTMLDKDYPTTYFDRTSPPRIHATAISTDSPYASPISISKDWEPHAITDVKKQDFQPGLAISKD